MNSRINKFNGATLVAKFSGAALVVAMGLLGSVGCSKHDDAPPAKQASEALNSEIVSEIRQRRSTSPEARAIIARLFRNIVAKKPKADLFLNPMLTDDEKNEEANNLDQDGRELLKAIREKCNFKTHTLDGWHFGILDSDLNQKQTIEKSSVGLIYGGSSNVQCPLELGQTLTMVFHPWEASQAGSIGKELIRRKSMEEDTKFKILDSGLREKLGIVAGESHFATNLSFVAQGGAEQNGNTWTKSLRVKSNMFGSYKFESTSGENIIALFRLEASSSGDQFSTGVSYKFTFKGETLTIGAEKLAGKSRYYINGQEVSAGEILYEFGISID